MLSRPEIIMRQMVEACPLRIGSRVKLKPDYKYADWRGEYVVVSLVWEYRDGQKINVGIASDDEIVHRYGYTDGFSVDDFDPVIR